MSLDSSNVDVSEEDLIRVRNWLNESAIKLWLPPLTRESGEPGELELQEVSLKASESLRMRIEVGAACVERLRQQAIENLETRKKFEETAQATLRVKLPDSVSTTGRRTIKVAIPLTMHGSDLKSEISNQTSIKPEEIKLICKGRVVKDELCLNEQGIRNNAQFLLIHMGSNQEENPVQQQEQRRKLMDEVQGVKRAAEYLAARAEDNKFHKKDINLNITNQNGKELQLPPSEKRALVLAMALHAKGKACIDRGSYDLALLVLLEADSEFQKCGSELLSCVDNQGLLQLDIVWCFFKLHEVSELPDADRRLTLCETKLEQAYGANMQRAVRLQGGAGHYVLLFLRLHLLQGITAFYRNRLERAHNYFKRAHAEYQRLNVPDEKLRQLMDYGFAAGEARIGLRFCENEVNQAIEHILKRQDEKKAMALREKEQRAKKMRRSLGRTANGSWVNLEHYNRLVDMGFSRSLVGEALRQTNNDIEQSVNLIQNNKELLQSSIAIRKSERRRPQSSFQGSAADVAQLVSLGCSQSQAQRALERSHGNVTAATELLMAGLSSSSSSSSSDTDDDDDDDDEREREMMEILMPDVKGDLDENLDGDLSEERQLLQRFSDMLAA